MHITVFGATGPTGLDLVDQALHRGWNVTAAVRSAGPLAAQQGLQVREGDIHDVDFVTAAVSGADAVISLLGFHRRLRGPSTTTLYSGSAATIIRAMQHAGARRLIYTTSAGVEHDDPAELWPYRHIVKPLWLDGTYDDMRQAEDEIRASGLDWTLVRPGRLVDGPATGHYLVSRRFRPEHANSITRGDLAAFILDQVISTAWIGGTPTLGTPRDASASGDHAGHPD